MERPTCKTCPYFQLVEDDDGSGLDSGICRRHAPRPSFQGGKQHDSIYIYEGYPCWPEVVVIEWCGEHPDFPAWIREQRRTRATPCIEDDPDVIRFDELWVTVRKAFHKLGVRTWADVADLTESRLMELERFGQSSLNMVKAELRIRGLQLRRSPNDAAL